MGKKINFEEYKKAFEEKGLELLETQVINHRQSLKYRCKCGNESQCRIDSVKNNTKRIGCKSCVASSQRISYDEVKKAFEQSGYELLSKEYINANKNLKYKCNNGHITSICYSKLKQGQRCKKCLNETQKLSFEEIKAYFKEQNCELLEKKYISSKSKMSYICSCGKKYSKDWNHFRISSTCIKCQYVRLSQLMSGENHPKWQSDREKIKYHRLLATNYRRVIHRAARYLKEDQRLGPIAEATIQDNLGYNWQALKDRIENHPNWEKVKDEDWHLDHIFPIKAFLDYDITDVKLINCLDNLQPLPAKENIAKKDKYDKQEFESWLQKKRIK